MSVFFMALPKKFHEKTACFTINKMSVFFNANKNGLKNGTFNLSDEVHVVPKNSI